MGARCRRLASMATDTDADTRPRRPARNASCGTRPVRPAVRDPAVLRHRRDDGRRHQPRGWGARLRHAAGHRRGRRREPARGPDPLHEQPRDARAAARAVAPPRGPLRRRLRPGQRDHGHGRGLGGGRSRPARDLRSRRRGDPPRAVVRGLRPGDRLRRRRRAPRRDPLRGRLRARPGGRRGRHHAADQGALPRLPVQPDRGRAARRRPGRPRRHRRPPRPAGLQRRDLRPARVRDLPAPGDERAARDARADDPDGRLLEGVRDDRLAGRLRRGAGRDPRGDVQGPPVRDHVGPDDRSGRRARRRSSRASPRSSGCSPSTTGDAA